MTVEQLVCIYKDKKEVPCPITERLIKAGYQQESGGYISYAKETGMEVDYTKAQPSQWWHLIESYCNRSDSEKVFGKRIKCGELIFWMAEVLNCVSVDELNSLADEIIQNSIQNKRKSSKPKYNRRIWNKKIQDLCFDKILDKVESLSK